MWNCSFPLIANLPTIIVEIVKAVPQILAGLVSAFGKGVSQLAEVGGNLVRGLWQGSSPWLPWLWNKVSGWISSIWDGICDFFGIASPSKEMGWVGEMLVEGLAGAINANGKDAVAAAEGMSSEINDVMHSLADDMTTALPTDFTVNGTVNRNDTASGIGGMGYGAPLPFSRWSSAVRGYPQDFPGTLQPYSEWLPRTGSLHYSIRRALAYGFYL